MRERQEIQEVSRQGGIAPTSPFGRLGLWRGLSAGASGLLLAAAFPPLDIGWIAWAALVPLLWSLRGVSMGAAFSLGYLMGAVWFGVALSWAILFGVPTWAVLTALLALYVAGFAVLLRWLVLRHPRWGLALIPLVWVAVEVARSAGPLGIPWVPLGLSQHRTLPVLQIASLGGVYLVSLAVALGNALLLALLQGPRRMALIGAAAMLLAAAIAFGIWRVQTPLHRTIRVAVLQPNVPPLQKGTPATWEAQITTMRTLTAQAHAAGADLIVFPETAMPVNLLGPYGLASQVGEWAPGRVVVASSLEVGEGLRNSVIVLHGRDVLGVYTKRRLVPFAEPSVTPGIHGKPIATPVGTLGIAICYESAFPEIGRAAAQQGSDLLLVLTNDGWFGPATGGPGQHAAYAPVRAVETGRFLVRAANTGISMTVDPHGRVQRRLPLDVQSVIVTEATAPVRTLYLRGGWLFPMFLLAGVSLLSLAPAFRALPGWWQEAGFIRLVATLAGPGTLALLGPWLGRVSPFASRWVIPIAILLAAAMTGGGWRALTLRPRRAPLSALLGLGIVGGLGATMAIEYASYLGLTLRLPVPEGGWFIGGLSVLLSALAWEAWLHGAVFTAARAWRGTAFAIILSTVPALVIYWGAVQEVLFWSVFTGAIFAGIRVLTGDVLGLALARAAGILVLAALPALRI